MNIRKPAVAGQFYGGSRSECLAEIQECMPDRIQPADELPQPIVAGIVPHAGWMFSGPLAAAVFKAIQQVNGDVDTFVLFGAAHRYFDGAAVVYDSGQWETPLGRVDVDTDLAQAIVAVGGVPDPAAHKGEHSIEVQVPFIQHLFPRARIVPVIVPASGFDAAFAAQVGKLLQSRSEKTVCIASTDLTHYGPRYGFCPEGAGQAAIRWAKEVNDMQFIELALRMEAEDLVETAMESGSACGPAAVGTVVAAAKAMGRNHGVLLGHTTSSEIMMEKFNQTSEESVGYAAIVF
jgi:AmmeMemoRadiSam system protein B